MKQLARRASLVVVLLLASVGTASAECAWVLWGRADDVWTDAKCREARLRLSDDSRKVREIRRPDLAQQDHFECWPDTVDPSPRGPKGK